jgi:hypothetical protein
MASNASVTVKSVRAAGGKKLLALFGLLSVGCTAALYAQTPPAYTYVHEVVVVLPTDNGNNASPLQGTLRWAIMQANSREGGKTRIRFNIPPAFGTPPYVIQVEPSRPLPNITKPTIIDGTTQPANGYTGNAPKIILQGRNDNSPNRTDLVTAGLGLNRGSNGSIVKGLQVRYFLYGIMMKETAGILIDGNVIYGLYSLGKNLGIGIDITRTENSFLRNNIIGTDPAGTVFPAQANGIWVSDNSDYCFIGEAGQGNRIVNLLNGIRVGSSGPAYHVRVTESLIYDVLGYPILIADDSNTPRGKTPPVISEVDVNLGEISGTTGHAGDRVEVFACSPNNVAQTGDGKTYIGSATTNALGEWTLTGFNYTSGQNVFSATRTDLQNNTSHFSPPFVINPCELVRTNQNPVIRITSPAPFSEAGVTDNINWTITSVPALTPQTDNKHTRRHLGARPGACHTEDDNLCSGCERPFSRLLPGCNFCIPGKR